MGIVSRKVTLWLDSNYYKYIQIQHAPIVRGRKLKVAAARIRTPDLRLTSLTLRLQPPATDGAADGMIKHYSDVTRISIMDPNQFRLRKIADGPARHGGGSPALLPGPPGLV